MEKEAKTGFREEKVKTDIDRLLDLVKKRKKVSFPQAAKTLHVEELQIEDWGNILEGHGFVKLHYPLIGDPIIKDMSMVKSDKAKKPKPTSKKPKKPHKKTKKKAALILTLSILCMFFGYIFLFDNLFTLNVRSRLTLFYNLLYDFITGNLFYLAIILIIIIAASGAVLTVRRLKKRKKKKKEEKPGKKTEKPKGSKK